MHLVVDVCLPPPSCRRGRRREALTAPPQCDLPLARLLVERAAEFGQLGHVAAIDQRYLLQQLQEAILQRVDDLVTVLVDQLDNAIECLGIEHLQFIALEDLPPIQPFAGLQHAEVLTQLVREHATD